MCQDKHGTSTKERKSNIELTLLLSEKDSKKRTFCLFSAALQLLLPLFCP